MSTKEPPVTEATQVEPKKRGRPKKTEVLAKKKGKGLGNPVGRPKGEAALMNEFKARLLNSPRSRKVLDAIFEAALDPEHKAQAAAWKLIMDRVAPVSSFEQEVLRNGSGRNTIQINITGVPNVNVSGESQDEPLEGDYYDTDDT